MSEGQKYLSRNQVPRVQIEYDTETYGAAGKTQLPFLMGVMSDLSGKSLKAKPSISERKFKPVDIDNFDQHIKEIAPRVQFDVANRLVTGAAESQMLKVDMTFGSIDDFSPDKVAEKVAGISDFYKMRQQLANLLSYIDGKENAEELIMTIIQDKGLREALMATPKPATDA